MKNLTQNPAFYWFSMLLVILACSCRSKKLNQVPIKTTIENSTVKSDSSIHKEKIVVNAAITDTTQQAVPKAAHTGNRNCDSLAQAHALNVLRGLNTRKTSGNVSYGFHFDEKKGAVVAYMNVAESQNKASETTKAKSDTTANTQIIEKPVEVLTPVPFIPLWIKILTGIGWTAAVVLFLVLRYKK